MSVRPVSPDTATVLCAPVRLCVWLLPAPTAERSVRTETASPAEPKIHTRWPFLEKTFADAGLGGLALEEAEWAGAQPGRVGDAGGWIPAPGFSFKPLPCLHASLSWPWVFKGIATCCLLTEAVFHSSGWSASTWWRTKRPVLVSSLK